MSNRAATSAKSLYSFCKSGEYYGKESVFMIILKIPIEDS